MGRKADYQWYPVAKSQIENEDFRKLSPTGKLYYWLLSSEFNRYTAEFGEYYRPDQWFAVALGVEVITIRKIRRHLKKLGFIDYKNGHKNKQGRPVATTYYSVKWSRVEELEEGDSFSRNRRYSFEMLLALVRQKALSQADLVVYVYLEYFRDVNQLKDHGRTFFITKKQLREYSNIKDAGSRLAWLYDEFEFSGGSHLFEYTEEYHRIVVTDWSTPVEPGPEEGHNNYSKYKEDIESRIKDAKRKAENEEINRLRAKGEAEGTIYVFDQLVDYFKEKYIEFHGKKPQMKLIEEDRLEMLAETYSVENVAGMIDYYFKADEVPNPTNALYRTLARFNRTFETMVYQREELVKRQKEAQ